MSSGRWNDTGTGDWSTPSALPPASQSTPVFGVAAQPATPLPFNDFGGTGLGGQSPTGEVGGAMSTGRPPLVFLAIATALGVAGLVLGFVVGSSPLALIGWVLAGPIAFAVVAFFSFRDTVLRGEGLYAQSGATKPLYILALLSSVAGVAMCAVQFAFWVGRL